VLAVPQDLPMPLDLSDTGLTTAATTCRAMAYQAGERTKKIENPTVRGPLDSNAKRYPPWARSSRRRGGRSGRILAATTRH
jgi:hypothetical protein